MIRSTYAAIPALSLALLVAGAAPALAQPIGFQMDPLQNTCGKLAAYYDVELPNGVKTKARLRSSDPESAQLSLDMPGGTTLRLTLRRTIANNQNRLVGSNGTSGGVVGTLDPTATVRVDVRVMDRITLKGTVATKQADGTFKTLQVTLKRGVAPARTDLADVDVGPSPAQQALFESIPAAYEQYFDSLWGSWGPTYYRGRLDKSARVLIIGSDPGPTECLPFVRRCMIGDTGQRVQGLLHKLGLDRSYLIMNAFPYALHPSASNAGAGDQINANPEIVAWRNKIFASAIDGHLQAVILFGFQARDAWNLWPDRPNVPVFELKHPSNFGSHMPDSAIIPGYRRAVESLRAIVTPDSATLRTNNPNYGREFTEFDFGIIPRRDLPRGATIGGTFVATPEWIGSDSWTRARLRPIHNVVKRQGEEAMWLNYPDGTKRLIEVTAAPTPGGQPTYSWGD